jgi:hypothetical protein
MRVLVCGGRDYEDYEGFKYILDGLLDLMNNLGETVLIHGGAKGADSMCDKYAKERFDITVERYPAQWIEYGKAAGFIRNKQMLVEGKPDCVFAFPGGKGTDNMIQQALKAKVKILQF